MSSKKRKQTFVLVIPRFEDIYHSYFSGEIIKGVSQTASRLMADILIHITDRTNHKNWLDSSLTDHAFVDGVIFADIDNDLSVVTRAINAGIPCMILNNILREPVNYIAMDNRKAAIHAVEYLIDCGHEKIATIAGDMTTQSGLQRLEGYREALDSHHIESPRRYVTFGDYLRTPARKAAERLLKMKERPTAIFVASDVMALELLDVAQAMKIKVPQELSIIGFDDNPLATTARVPLTTVAQPLVEMGRQGAEQLNLVSKGKVQLPVKITLPTQLIERSSVLKLTKTRKRT